MSSDATGLSGQVRSDQGLPFYCSSNSHHARDKQCSSKQLRNLCGINSWSKVTYKNMFLFVKKKSMLSFYFQFLCQRFFIFFLGKFPLLHTHAHTHMYTYVHSQAHTHSQALSPTPSCDGVPVGLITFWWPMVVELGVSEGKPKVSR